MAIPTFNGADYLVECLRSVAAQDLSGVEVLIIDDGSSDATLDVAASFGDRIDRLRILHNTVRLGPAANLQRCIDEARGQWIKPVFQDDTIEPDCLSTMRAARRRGVPVVVCARRYQYEHGVPAWREAACDHLLAHALDRRFGSGLVPASIVADIAAEMAAERVPQLNFIGEPVAYMFHRDTARRTGGVDTGYVQLWDYELVLRLALRRGIVVVEQPLATFRVHEASETARNLLPSALFRTNVMDRLRLQVTYVVGRGHRQVRLAADRRGTSADLTALALGAANAGRRLVEELPAPDREQASAELEEVAAPLPVALDWGSEAERIASEAEVALFCIVSTQPEPEFLPILARPNVIPSFGSRLKQRAQRLLRVSQWWGHMLGPIVAFALLQVGWREVSPGAAFTTTAALVCSAIALAGYGYLVNDASDVAADRAAGKRNLVGKMAVPARLAVIAAFAVAGAVPWVWITLEPPALAVLAGIYLVPLLYSPRPVRLKERHVLGPIADASNAFVLPAMFTIALFAPLGEASGPWWLMVAGAVAWGYGFGLRAILLHQIADVDNDRAAGTRTLVSRAGVPRAVRAMRTVLFPLELAGLVVLSATVATWSWGAVAVGLGWAAAFNGARLSGAIPRGLATTTVEQGWFMYWYQIWPALLLAAALAVGDPAYLSLMALVVVLFWSRITSAMQVVRREVVREQNRRRRATEHSVPAPDRMAGEG